MDDQIKKTSDERSDIDLGTILHATSRGLRKLASVINSFVINLGEFFLFFLIFLKKRIIWILLSAVIGFAYGSYLSYSNGNKYYSSLTARFNFDSRRALYNNIEYFNSLVIEGRFSELSGLLSISEKEAASLIDFYAEPIENELIVSDLYKQQFFNTNRSIKLRTDTFWIRTIPYKEFKNSLTKYDIPLQKITVTSTRMDIFSKIQAGLIANISTHDVLKKNQEILQATQNDEELIIINSLKGLDTLRNVYNERLRKEGGQVSERNTLAVLNQPQTIAAPELELYDKLLGLKDELKVIRNDKALNRQIVQVLASFNSVGQRVSILRQNAVKYCLQAIALCLAILVILEVNKAVNNYEKRKKQVDSTNKSDV